MPLIHCDFRSNVLGLETAMTVILPQPGPVDWRGIPEATSRRYPTLYLLHGLSGNHTDLHRRTLIERYAAPLDLAIVMPSVHRSFYTDMACGPRFWTFLSEELPVIAQSLFPLSKERKDNFVAGISMGGYGAFKWALSCPDRFAAAASLSTPMEVSSMIKVHEGEEWQREMKAIFGELDLLEGGKHDLFYLAEQAAKWSGDPLRLYQWCGTEDPFYPANLHFRQHAERLGLNLTYEEGPGGHDYGAWDAPVRRLLEWLPLQKNS
jgi:putative tributyrin esterase